MMIHRKSMRILIAGMEVTFFGAACHYDEVSRSYATLADAREDIEKGWIPDCLPPSTHHLSDSHDLDTNRGEGTFEFAPVDFAMFQVVTPLTDADLTDKKDWRGLKEAGYHFVTSGEFILAVNPSGQGRYWFSLNRF